MSAITDAEAEAVGIAEYLKDRVQAEQGIFIDIRSMWPQAAVSIDTK